MLYPDTRIAKQEVDRIMLCHDARIFVFSRNCRDAEWDGCMRSRESKNDNTGKRYRHGLRTQWSFIDLLCSFTNDLCGSVIESLPVKEFL